MRITPRDKWARRIALPVCLLVMALLLRRGLLVGCVALKILGHPSPLDFWKGAANHESVVHAGIPIDIYSGRHSASPILIVHGVNPTGKDSVDLIRVSEALAQAGYRVFVPDFADMRRQHLRPEAAARIKSVFQFIGSDAAIACFSYGCGPAMIAAADSEIRDHVRFAVAFGGYFDLRETLEYVVTRPQTDQGYLKWVYLAANSDLVAGESDRQTLQAIAEHHLSETTLDEAEAVRRLSPQARALFDIFAATTPEQFRAKLQAGPVSLQRRLDSLSPSHVVRNIRAPLTLVHGINDPVIPAQQTVEFAKAARENGMVYSLTLLQMYGHVNPILPEKTPATLFSFYLPETIRFLGVLNRVIGAM